MQLSVDEYLVQFLQLHLFFEIALGTTAVAVLHNVVGLKTYGTFGAVIVAVSMLVAGPLLGFLIFTGLLAAVIVSRAAIAREGIQGSHRVAILVTMVAIAAVGTAVLGLTSATPALAYVVLFPILITAWFAERFVEDVSREGGYKGIRTMAFTFVAVVVAYAVMLQHPLVLFVIHNPLSWAGLVLLNWFLGTRVRFRFSERFRFRGTATDGDDVDLAGTVLTMNRRNRDYIDRYNPSGLLATLDKARVKSLLVPLGVPMPETYLLVRGRRDLPRAEALIDRLQAFVVKPASSYGGEGILLVRGRAGDRYRVNGHIETKAQLLKHLRRIVDGEFNDGKSDVVILEELLVQDPSLDPLSPEGVADIRVVTLLGHPVMAMARLPTRSSRGRANLHSGAVGAGIDLSTGRLTSAVWNGERVEVHPDTGVPIRGFRIPRWAELLEIASEAQEASGLGFAGVDIVLDARHGPTLLEVNRRPGLEIQNANRAGLLPRLRAIEARAISAAPPERRVQVSLDLNAREWGTSSKAVPGPAPPSGVFPPANGR